MAASLGILKSLPCPAGNQCTAFQCLFKHDHDEPEPTPLKAEQPIKQATEPTSADGDVPRKRIKLTAGSPLASETTLVQPKPDTSNLKAKPDATAGSSHRDNRKFPMPSTTVQEVQRATTVAGNGATAASVSKVADSNTIGNKATDTHPAQKSSAKAVPRKPETLNPRHLKRSPAKHDMRWKLVQALHEQYTRLNTDLRKASKDGEAALIMSDQELITRTLDEEEEIAVKKFTIYATVIKNKIMSYKRMTVDQWRQDRAEIVQKAEGATSSQEVHKLIDTGLTPAQEIDFLHRLSTDFKGYERFGYVSSVPKEEDVEKARKAVEASGNVEVCDRCTRRFTVYPGRREDDGALTSGGPCIHHPGKTYFVQKDADDKSRSLKKWHCCDQTVGDTEGCTTSNEHVFKTSDPNRLATVLNFVETPANPSAPADRAVCFDCEMGYTVYGMELIRLTAVSWPTGEELLDVLVYPVGEYIDLNTRYSGVRPEDMVEAERWKPGEDPSPTLVPSTDPSKPPGQRLKLVPSPKDARDLFFSLLSPDTPIIGHGLENDLNTLRVIHPVCVDTILLFPHKRGLPIRNSLKWLMEAKLERKIQMNTSETGEKQGHDSAEDARAAGELVRLKIKEEWGKMQMKGWTIMDNGSLAPPDDNWTLVESKKMRPDA